VTVSTAVEKNVPVRLRAIGTVQAYSTVAVKSQVEGEIIRVHFKEGGDVKQGDLLFTIDPRPFEAQIRQAEANQARDKVQAANARKDLSRYAELLKEGSATQAQYDQIRTNSEALDAALQADEAALDTARLQLSYSTIRSPIDGRTGSIMIHEGNLVKANDASMVVINQVTPIYVAFSVPQQDLPEIKKEMAAGPLKVEASPPRSESSPSIGVLTFVDNAVDPATGTIQLKATFRNKERALWPGQFVNVVLNLAVQHNAVVIPSQAVQSGQQGDYVFVVKSDRTVESRPVEMDRTVDHDAVIRKGVRPGEEVVTDGQLRLIPGVKIEIRPSAAGPGTEGGAS
jgi:multidrug efflux system membrane fusion protein